MSDRFLNYTEHEIEYLLMCAIMVIVHFIFSWLEKRIIKKQSKDRLLIWALWMVSSITLVGAVIMIVVLVVCNVWTFVWPLITSMFDGTAIQPTSKP